MKIFRVILVVAVLIYILLMPQFLIFQDFFHKQFHSVLKLKIRDTYNGGEVLVSFNDRLNDDNGFGELTYPRSPNFKDKGSGLLDLVSFTVFKPQTEEDWSRDNIYWQFKYKFQNLIGSKEAKITNPIISHYIGIDGIDFEGSYETLHKRSELVTFKRPWHYVIEIYEDKAVISSANGEFVENIKIMIAENLVITRIPLEQSSLKHIFTNPETYHYVLTGAYDFYSEGKYLPVKKKSTSKVGGGAKSRLTPRIYDLIVPEGYKQSELLSGFNEDEFTYAKLEPVVADLKLEYKDDNKLEFPPVEELRAKVKVENERNYREKLETHDELKLSLEGKDDVDSLLALGKSYFNIGDLIESSSYLEKVIEMDSGNAVATAYLGSVRATEAGETDSIAKSMEYVNLAFEYYDNALVNIKSINEELEVLLNRAYVAQSVPESVFYKSEVGANDFLRVVEICNQLGQSEKVQHYYIMASICFKQAGKQEESDIYFGEAISMGKLKSSDMLKIVETN